MSKEVTDSLKNVYTDSSFQYGQVIKLPLQILQSIHGQPYGIDPILYRGEKGIGFFTS